MSQLAQLSEAEIEERFHITGKKAVQFLLAGYAQHKVQFMVQFNFGQEHYLTLILDAPDNNTLIFDCSGSQDINRRFLESQHNVFLARPDGIQVQFSTGSVKEVKYDGAKAFSVALPDHVLRLQRREFFRIETPHIRPLVFHIRLPDLSFIELPAHDISISGLALTASEEPKGLETGMLLERCFFRLPDDKTDVVVNARIRHISEITSRAGKTQWRIGIEFVKLPHGEENRIQRYIARIEHERHELS